MSSWVFTFLGSVVRIGYYLCFLKLFFFFFFIIARLTGNRVSRSTPCNILHLFGKASCN